MTDFNIEEPEEPVFATFWERTGAYLLDGLIIGGISTIVNVVNIYGMKSFYIFLLMSSIGILYKPYMESKYGATFGKMIVKLRVTDTGFNGIDMKQSFLRSFILILPSILLIPFYYLAFENPAVMDANGFIEFATAMGQAYPMMSIVSNLSFVVLLAEIVVILTDNTNKQRSLHDRIAKTYVIHGLGHKEKLEVGFR